MANLSIGEVARRSGLKPSAIRYYEQIGLLPAPLRSAGRRMYSDSILDRLSILSFAKHAGFSLKEVQALLVDNHGNRPLPQRWRELAHHKIVELETFIAHANSVLEELKKTISPMCPRLAERGRALRSRNTASPVLQVRAAKRRR